MKNLYFYESPVGRLGIAAENNNLTGVFFDHRNNFPNHEIVETPIIKLAAKQLEEYFQGERKAFDLPLLLQGTEFQQSVWGALQTIPYGETRSYKEIATQIGNPKASRAVGHSNHKNPLAIIIPCHRVIGQNGKITGYAGGLEAKRFLLELESQQYFAYG